MWILESDGEFLQGKRVWLKPGQRYLFGRVKKDGVFQAIDHKGVSRRHCVIEVDNVSPGDGSSLHARSKLFVTDEGSKGGTTANGKKVAKGAREELNGLEHHLKLGSYPKALDIQWQPICLSCYLTAKDKKQSDPLASKRRLMEPLDIKTVELFVSNQTTHVVASKRNTVPGLQALISAKHIVDNSYLDALVCAATPEDLEGDENLSPLEKDFDAAWPDPLRYLPPRGREPTTKSSDSYLPDLKRESVFEDWVFVFLDPGQYESIFPAINSGHGKALLCQVKNGTTTAKEVVTYMRNAAGHKGFASSDAASISGGVVMVKPVLKSEWTEWCEGLVNQVASQLGQQHIDQAEFLDAILSNDARSLKRAVLSDRVVGEPPRSSTSIPAGHSVRPSHAFDPAGHVAAGVATVTPVNGDTNIPDSPHPVAAEEEAAPVRKRPRTRAPPISRFKAFDDGFNMDAVPQYEPNREESAESSVPPQDHTEANGISQDYEGQEEQEDARSDGHGNKRRRSQEDDEVGDGFLPAATALKRRRLDLGRAKKKMVDAAEEQAKRGKGTKPRAKVKKELDIRAAARERREAEEEVARRDQEMRETDMGDVCVEDLKNLAVVEEMTIPQRGEQGSRVNRHAAGHWDEAWNGRKNFKKFRRKGEEGTEARRPVQNLIVPLVELRRKNFGIGEVYWTSSVDPENKSRLQNPTQDQTPAQAQAQTQTQTQTQTPVSTDETITSGANRFQQDAEEIVSTADTDRSRQTRGSGKPLPSQATLTSDKGKGKGKRPASSAGSTQAGSSKRQRTIRTKAASESESDGELRFKFGSRRK